MLACMGLIFATLVFKIQIDLGFDLYDVFINALEILTIIVPPSLPTALGAGISFAVSRLS